MADLEKGYSIQTKECKKVVVESKLGEGGQGAVYKVTYDGSPKALKWYHKAYIKRLSNPDKFYENIQNIIKMGKPTGAFLRPQDITERDGEVFGYIMDLFPPEYTDFARFLLGKEGFSSVTAMVNAALHISAGFRELQKKGYTYQDLNDGNFRINPKTGDVLICDNDNVSEYGKDSGIAGKARYMAPEIVLGKGKPGMFTDRFSLAVVLFLLWTNNHPLEGKAAYPQNFVAKQEKKIYGENPVFIFDPDDNSNRPVQGMHSGAINSWPLLPEYLRNVFIKEFSKDLLCANPNSRRPPKDWQELFIRMRGEVYKCSCGEVYFADPVTSNPCPQCRKPNSFPFTIKIEKKYHLPVHQRTKLYACHTEKDSEDFQTLTGEIAVKDKGFELKNGSSKNWTVTDGGAATALAPNAAVMLKKGLHINFGGANAEIV